MLVYVILPELFGVEKIAGSSGISFTVYGVSGLLSPPFGGRKIITMAFTEMDHVRTGRIIQAMHRH